MKPTKFGLLSMGFAAGLVALVWPSPLLPPVAGAESDRHVIVVSLDGLAAYLVDDPKVPLPTIRRLATQGAIAQGGMTVSNPSVTWPNHTTVVTGVRPDKHGVLANGMLEQCCLRWKTSTLLRR